MTWLAEDSDNKCNMRYLKAQVVANVAILVVQTVAAPHMQRESLGDDMCARRCH